VKRLAAETPAIYIVFDLLADEDGKSLLSRPLSERRARLEKFAAAQFEKGGSVYVSPATTRLAQAKKWLAQTGSTLDGIIAKRRDLAYPPGSRDGVVKVKPEKTADCVVVGVRWK
jgi:ATP-dependent DNA ligase